VALFPKKAYTIKDKKRDAKNLFASEQGKRFLKNLEVFCGANKQNNPKNLTTEQILFNEGQRSVYLMIRELLSDDIILTVERDNGFTNNSTSRANLHPDPKRR